MGERKTQVELATAAAQAKSAALDAELVAKMARYVVMNKEMVAMGKEHDAFNNDITMSFKNYMESTLSSTKRPPTVVLKALDLNQLKRNLRRKLSIGLVSRDCGKKGMRKSPLKHTGLPPLINATVRRKNFDEGTIYLLGALLSVFHFPCNHQK
uniref:Uncharacterized protein n=1 Tax=Solanum tuberosum TaxID=4113 RepID=M1DJ88_SOLTU